jgi:hypothetical protein
MNRRLCLFAVLALCALLTVQPGAIADVDDDREDFLERMESTVYRHGTWTIQEVVHHDPSYDAAFDYRSGHVNIFHGRRLVWTSGKWPSAGFYVPDSEGDRTPLKWVGGDGLPSRYPVSDVTGGDGVTAVISTWSGKGGGSFRVLRLEGEGSTGKVEILYSGGGYDSLKDLDGDGIREVIAMDVTHGYSAYMGYPAHWPWVVLKWDVELGRYKCAQSSFEAHMWRDDENPERTVAELVARSIADCKAALDAPKERLHCWLDAFVSLSGTALSLLYIGRADEAIELAIYSNLETYDWPGAEEPRSREQWWALLIEGCRKSPYWASLCECYPRLKELDQTAALRNLRLPDAGAESRE